MALRGNRPACSAHEGQGPGARKSLTRGGFLSSRLSLSGPFVHSLCHGLQVPARDSRRHRVAEILIGPVGRHHAVFLDEAEARLPRGRAMPEQAGDTAPDNIRIDEEGSRPVFSRQKFPSCNAEPELFEVWHLDLLAEMLESHEATCSLPSSPVAGGIGPAAT
jgi:hypothetical protein